jgi:hypothetical protein
MNKTILVLFVSAIFNIFSAAPIAAQTKLEQIFDKVLKTVDPLDPPYGVTYGHGVNFNYGYMPQCSTKNFFFRRTNVEYRWYDTQNPDRDEVMYWFAAEMSTTSPIAPENATLIKFKKSAETQNSARLTVRVGEKVIFKGRVFTNLRKRKIALRF